MKIKRLIIIACLTLIQSSVFACPGGHLVSLNDYEHKGGQSLALLNKSNGELKITAEGFQFREALASFFDFQGTYVDTVNLCRALACDIVSNSGSDPVTSLEIPKEYLSMSARFKVVIAAPNDKLIRGYIFSEDLFSSARGCGTEVDPL